MGQQQLLLVILVTIIVGIATVVAINTFGAAADTAAQDAVRQDIASIAAGAQGYYMKPRMLGGGARSFDGLTFNDIAFSGGLGVVGGEGDDADDENPREATNQNGTFTLVGTDGETYGTGGAQFFTVEAVVNDTDQSVIWARICRDGVGISPIGATAAPDNCD